MQCLFCSNPITRFGTKNKFCSVNCTIEFQWKKIFVPRIEKGLVRNPNGIKRFLKETRGAFCEECKLGEEWNRKPLTLQLDHIDGNSDNNKPENLRLLCPNCHSQTETFGNSGLGSRYRKKHRRNRYLQKYKA